MNDPYMELYHSVQSIQSSSNKPAHSAQDHVQSPTQPNPSNTPQTQSGLNYKAAKFLVEHQDTWYGRAGIKALEWMSSPGVQQDIQDIHQANQEVFSWLTSAVPVLGAAKGITEMYTGYDVFTQQPVSKLEAGVEIGFGLLPEAGFFKEGAVTLADKLWGRRGVAETVTPVADHLGSVATETKATISNSPAGLFGKAGSDVKGLALKSTSDPLLDTVGHAPVTHPSEYKAIMQDLKNNGVQVRQSGSSISFAPNPSGGSAGNMINLPDQFSISALRHEYGHFLDHQALGYPRYIEYFKNPDLIVSTERRQYLNEIRYAKSIGDQSSRRTLIQNYLTERNYIIDRYYQEPYGYSPNNSSNTHGAY